MAIWWSKDYGHEIYIHDSHISQQILSSPIPPIRPTCLPMVFFAVLDPSFQQADIHSLTNSLVIKLFCSPSLGINLLQKADLGIAIRTGCGDMQRMTYIPVA
jgi:hypothetical protein